MYTRWVNQFVGMVGMLFVLAMFFFGPILMFLLGVVVILFWPTFFFMLAAYGLVQELWYAIRGKESTWW